MKSSAKDRGSIEILHATSGELALLIKGRRVGASQTKIALLAALRDNVGSVVTYSHLCGILGYDVVHRKPVHILRQYIGWWKRTLAAHKIPFVITVAPEVGYALCAIAPI